MPSARMRSFLGLTTTLSPAPHFVLYAPIDWRERMRDFSEEVAVDKESNDETLNIADAIDASIGVPGLPPALRVAVPRVDAPSRPAPTPAVAARRATSSATTRETRAGARAPAQPVETGVVETGETHAPPVAIPPMALPASATPVPVEESLEILNAPAEMPSRAASPVDVPNAPPRAAASRAEPPSVEPLGSPIESETRPVAQHRESSPAEPAKTAQPRTMRAAAAREEPAIQTATTPTRPVLPDVAPTESAGRSTVVSREASPRQSPEGSLRQADGTSSEPLPIAAAAPQPAEEPRAAARAPDASQAEPSILGNDVRVESSSIDAPPAIATTKPVEHLAGAPTPRPTTPDLAQPTEMRRARRAPLAQPPRATEPRETERAAAKAASTPSDTETPRTPSTDRTLTEWRKLLFEATVPKSAAPRAAPQARPASTNARTAPATSPAAMLPGSTPPRQPPAEPLRESTRRFLKPRVGIDPASVPIVRGHAADQLLGADADAAAIGETVVLPSSHDEQSPRTLGLLAHELTHVAQRRQPSFVPPVARPSGTRPAQAVASRASSRPPSSEESLARYVEQIVVHDAEDDVADAPAIVTPGESVRDYSSPHVGDVRTVAAPAEEWGGLPAPWEPLPIADFAAPAAGPPSPAPTAAFADTPVHFAEHGRTVDESHQQSAAHAPQPHDAAPPPDLDALARRVYDVLKRRLAAERRREG